MINNIGKLKENPNFQKVRKWAFKKGIIFKGNELTQKLKLIEEFGELVGGVLKDDDDLIKDSIGDMIVVLINLNYINGYNLEDYISITNQEDGLYKDKKRVLLCLNFGCTKLIGSKSNSDDIINSTDIISLLYILCIKCKFDINKCFNLTYNTIKDRTGKNINGNFIKDE